MECYFNNSVENPHYSTTNSEPNYGGNNNLSKNNNNNDSAESQHQQQYNNIYHAQHNSYHTGGGQHYGELCPVELEENDLWINQSAPYMTSEMSIQSNLSSSSNSGKIFFLNIFFLSMQFHFADSV